MGPDAGAVAACTGETTPVIKEARSLTENSLEINIEAHCSKSQVAGVISSSGLPGRIARE
jgi:hypothetical protein